jgi:hypothetical protein
MAPTLEPTAIQAKALDEPDDTKNIDKTNLDYVTVGGVKLVRTTFEPGWTWLGSIAPGAGTETCQATHVVLAEAHRGRCDHRLNPRPN